MCSLELIVSVGDIVSILFPIEDQGMFYGFLCIYACVVLRLTEAYEIFLWHCTSVDHLLQIDAYDQRAILHLGFCFPKR